MPPINPKPKEPKEPTPEELRALHDRLRELCGKKPVKSVAKTLKEYCKELYKHGWKEIVVQYSGSGDNCDDFEAKIWNEEDEFSMDDVKSPPKEFMQKVQDAIWDLLPSGFENNEGGSGEVKIDIETGKITVEHDQYYIESTHTSETY